LLALFGQTSRDFKVTSRLEAESACRLETSDRKVQRSECWCLADGCSQLSELR
jgi:hypothetical protein